MTWMAPIPRSDTAMPWHWVPEGAPWCGFDKEWWRPPGYKAACGTTAVKHPRVQHQEADADRPVCEICRRAAF